MKEQINKIKENSLEEVENAQNLNQLSELRVKYLGKKGEITSLLKEMKNLSKEEKPEIGALINTVRDNLEQVIHEKEIEFEDEELKVR